MSNTLAVKTDQDFWDERQLATLVTVGLQGAPRAELAVFLHFCQRTGLDPFARQIYMIPRGGKYTIQASIDGLRLVANRSGNYGGQDTQWCGEDGKWVEVWLKNTPPVAARAAVYYKDSPHPVYAVAKFSSYNAGSAIWQKMPDLMIAKCAEALALRKAFPQDLSGIYSQEEMEQSDSVTVVEAPRLSAVKDEPKTSGWSSRIGIGAVMAAQAVDKNEMPTPTSPILDAEEVDEWGIAKVKVEGWGTESFEAAEQFVTESSGETCEHGARRKQEGISKKSNKPYLGWHCPNKVCETVWYHQDPVTSEWVK